MSTRASLRRGPCEVVYRVRACSQATHRPPLVFLHGLASNMSRWAELVRQTHLAERHDLIRVDLRGHGESMTRTAFTREDWCDDLLALLDHLSRAQAIFVGHSLGAQVAIALAARAPARVAAVALIDPIVVEALRPERKAMLARIPWYQRAARLVRALNRIGLYRRSLPPLDLEAMDRQARIALQNQDALAAFVRQYSSARADLKHIPHANYIQDIVELFRPLPPLSALRCPVLLLRSSKADFHDPARMEAQLAAIANLETVLIDCHHWAVTEKPAEVRACLERWVAKIAP